jgi:hypothetical protein
MKGDELLNTFINMATMNSFIGNSTAVILFAEGSVKFEGNCLFKTQVCGWKKSKLFCLNPNANAYRSACAQA